MPAEVEMRWGSHASMIRKANGTRVAYNRVDDDLAPRGYN